jgi:hypothetical protein
MFSIDMNLFYALLFVLALIAVDVLLGIAVALQTGTFEVKKLPQFLQTSILPYFISLFSLVLLAQFKDLQNLGTSALAWAVITAYVAKVLFVDLLGKLKTLFGFDVTDNKGFVQIKTLLILAVVVLVIINLLLYFVVG